MDVERSPAPEDLSKLMEEVRAIREELSSMRSMLQARPAAELLSKRQTARVLGIGRDTLQRLIECAQIKTTPWADGLKISRDEIERVKRDGVNRLVSMCSSPRKSRARKQPQPSTPAGSPLARWRHPSQRAVG